MERDQDFRRGVQYIYRCSKLSLLNPGRYVLFPQPTEKAQPAQDNCRDNLHPSTFKILIIPFQVHDQAPDPTRNREEDSPGCLNYPGG